MINLQEILSIITDLDESSPQKEDMPVYSVDSFDISSFDSEKLCAIIASSRYLGANKEVALEAMQELAKRRIAGDNLKFEEIIESHYKRFTPIKFELNNVSKMISPFLSGNKR